MAIAFVLKGYPRLSETFIAQEMLALEQRGLDIRIVSLRHPTDRKRHPITDQITASVSYLPEYLYQEPLRVWRAWRAVRGWPRYAQARRQWLADLRRDVTPNRIRRFGQALVLAHELPADVTALHAHFLHTPTSVARYAAMLTGLPWSGSAHAKDIWTTPDWEKREKLADCDWLVTCSAAAAAHLSALAPDDNAHGTVALVYHGLDLTRFPPRPSPPSTRNGSEPVDPVRLLSVGRAVPKKGYDDLIDALARLPADLHWRLTHIGGGPDLKVLKRRAERAGIADRIDWQGAQPQDAVLTAYREADLFVLASRIHDDGDRDGLPNVLLEAQSQALACIASNVSAVPEAIEDGVTGLLPPPRAPAELAAAIAALAADPERRNVMGAAGAARIAERFSLESCIAPLLAKFGLENETPAARQRA